MINYNFKAIAVSLIIIFCWRIFAVQVFIADSIFIHSQFKKGFYIVTYALFIYYLNLFLAFLTPKIDPALELEEGL